MATTQKTRCSALVHILNKPPTQYCPLCGERVNTAKPEKQCTSRHHAIEQSRRNRFCVDCGERLIQQVLPDTQSTEASKKMDQLEWQFGGLRGLGQRHAQATNVVAAYACRVTVTPQRRHSTFSILPPEPNWHMTSSTR